MRLVTHGGAGAAGTELDQGCSVAADRAWALLSSGGSAAGAVVSACVSLEDNPLYNAGTGSNFRLDGSIENDAALMTDDGEFGAVCAISGILNPVIAAREVHASPHLVLAGDGARAFACKRGCEPGELGTDRAREKLEKVRSILAGAGEGRLLIDADVLRQSWNYEEPWESAMGCSDTVGAVAMDGDGRFAAAGSTGGTAVMLRGRVGDTPMIGGGLFAGSSGAVAATGVGEEILRRLLCYRVYERMAGGVHPQEACEWGINLVPEEFVVGLIAVGATGEGVAERGGISSARRTAGGPCDGT